GAAAPPSSPAAMAHVARCAGCASELAESRSALELVARDPIHGAEPPLPLGALVARVQARIDAEVRPRRAWGPLAFTAGAVAAALLALLLAPWPPADGPVSAPPPVAGGALPAGGPTAVMPPDALRRLERSLERERAARYLSEAGDVLVTVASTPQHCVRKAERVEVGEEAERSRDLLARRRLLVEEDAPAVAAARGVLGDVEEMLRQVAALDACARPQDLEAIRGEIARRRLLMKIDLVTRELQG
ncbi:MAG TPA: hypothetical protein VMR21_02705, partial [Vicinamibacteria bacterium]|nr:hypothetical protein [Vicinamibacteria bacterium]